MRSQSIASPEDQSVTFVELFFDLVFVFSVTQVVSLLHDGLDGIVVAQAILVFWLVWWAWTQFTWALNAADTNNPLIQLGILLATAVTFFMAVALPDAFGERTLWFAVAYVVVRSIGLFIYAWVASENPSQRQAVRTFAIVSIGGLAAVLIGGLVGGALQFWFWAGAILLDVVAAAIAGRLEGWNVHPVHFSERHGLFVIIALGETLIVAAALVSGAPFSAELVAVAVLVVAISCALWWSYFARAKPLLDEALESSQDVERTTKARDVFSLVHFPMLFGVITYAFAVEESVAHPGETLPLDGRIALALGLLLFVGGAAVAVRRASGRLLLPRIVVTIVTSALIVGLGGVSGLLTLAFALAGIVVIALIEQRAGDLETGGITIVSESLDGEP